MMAPRELFTALAVTLAPSLLVWAGVIALLVKLT